MGSSLLTIIVVTYNVAVQSIDSINLFLGYNDMNDMSFVVIDNSTEASILRANKQYAESSSDVLIYYAPGSNIGLSKAYNTALSMTSSPWIMTIDDDTVFPNSYPPLLLSTIKKTSLDIVAPTIRTTSGRPMSPRSSLTSLRRSFITQGGNTVNSFAINSGLVIRRELIQRIGGYDENLFIDMIDHDLMVRLSNIQANRILVIESDVIQEFSGEHGGNNNALWARYKAFRIDFNCFCNKHHVPLMWKYATLARRLTHVVVLSLANIAAPIFRS